jgi:hypothetical protein
MFYVLPFNKVTCSAADANQEGLTPADNTMMIDDEMEAEAGRAASCAVAAFRWGLVDIAGVLHVTGYHIAHETGVRIHLGGR